MRVRALLGVVAAMSGCTFMTHKWVLERPPAATQTLAKRDTPLRIAVVMRQRDVPATFSSSTDGVAFVFTNVRQFYELAFRSLLTTPNVEVSFFLEPPLVAFDAYLYAEADLETTGWLNHHCNVQMAVTIQDASGEIVLQKVAKSVHDFFVIGLAGQACEAALTETFSDVAAATLAQLDQL